MNVSACEPNNGPDGDSEEEWDDPDCHSEAEWQVYRAGWQQWILASPEAKTTVLAALNPPVSEGHRSVQ